MNRVLDFNLRRNKLVLKPELEVSMIQEEIKEFWDSKTLAERIDAMIDVRYVYEGSQIKYNYNMKPMDKDLTTIVGQFHQMSTTIVARELGDDSQYLDKIMEKAWTIVCDCNEQKVAELDDNGKVIKQEGLPNATEMIAEMLATVITIPEPDAGK